MKHRHLLAVAIVLPLGACAGTSSTTQQDLIGCTAALVAVGSWDTKALIAAAEASTACKALAGDALDALIKSVSSGQQKAAAKAMMR